MSSRSTEGRMATLIMLTMQTLYFLVRRETGWLAM